MVFGKMLGEKLNVNVQFHATTRSPIEASCLEDYAIRFSYPITSCYNEKRQTYIYNLKKYDKVYIITDVNPTYAFLRDIYSALISDGDSNLDVSMLDYSDYSFIPSDSKLSTLGNKYIKTGSGIFAADSILKSVIDMY